MSNFPRHKITAVGRPGPLDVRTTVHPDFVLLRIDSRKDPAFWIEVRIAGDALHDLMQMADKMGTEIEDELKPLDSPYPPPPFDQSDR